jgi:hypothetical protein
MRTAKYHLPQVIHTMPREIPLSYGAGILWFRANKSLPKIVQASYLMEHGDAERSTLLSEVYHPVSGH